MGRNDGRGGGECGGSGRGDALIAADQKATCCLGESDFIYYRQVECRPVVDDWGEGDEIQGRIP